MLSKTYIPSGAGHPVFMQRWKDFPMVHCTNTICGEVLCFQVICATTIFLQITTLFIKDEEPSWELFALLDTGKARQVL